MVEGGWREGYRILAGRVARLPDVLRRSAVRDEPPLDLGAGAVPGFLVTGIGSSAAQARFLVHLLQESLALRARFVATSTLVAPDAPGGRDDVLVVFSQGLSPNARLALADTRRWRRMVLVTAVGDEGPRDDDKARWLGGLEAAGVDVRRFPGEDEYGTLVRVVGPMAGTWRALTLAHAIAAATGSSAGALPPADVERVCEAIARAPLLANAVETGWLDEPLAFLTFGAYGELVLNLRYKVLEGMLRPMPPVWDLLELAHGPFQQAYDRPATFLALARADAPGEAPLLDAAERMLVAGRHRLVRLEASLPGPLAIFEHEAMFDALLLRYVAGRRLDQIDWPGRGEDAPLYDLRRRELHSRRLELLTWPEVEQLLAEGCRTALIPLGSTEQHGPHLPFATDSWIAEALAERFCARVADAIRLPVVSLGCSTEHMDFPGTLDLRAATLAMVLEDVLRSAARHGFERAFVFSAHGGNYDALARALPSLRVAAAPMEVAAFTDLARLMKVFHRLSAAERVTPEASGHHAGEFETSILLGLRPGHVRRAAFARGFVEPVADAQQLFYPGLRRSAPDGTVGDPRQAAGERAGRYLDAWVDLLVQACDSARS